jgi:4-hydroxythreonine-4-phosphate dehydrogenase
MQVFVTQGHEHGIGLEVFFKTCLLLSDDELNPIELLAFQNSVSENLTLLKLPFKISSDSISLCERKINVTWLKKKIHSQSHTALIEGMKRAEKGGVLYTLPTSKDQFISAAGHTEYFRHVYKTPELGMFFSSPSMQVLLLTDHVAVNQLSSVLTQDMIYKKLLLSLETLRKWHWPTERILISGLNPHAGESGMIGYEDERVKKAIKQLLDNNKLSVSGPYPGDTMLLEKKSERDVLVYLFHDQGLGVFKGIQGFIGSNITLGLPYPRFSPDHGTSFSLFGKNVADYRGCAFSLRQAIDLTRMSHGQNSSHQGPRP